LQQGSDTYEFMVSWWRGYDGFPPYPPTSIADLLWYPNAFLRFVYMAFRAQAVVAPGSNDALSDPAALGLAIALAASLVVAFIWRSDVGLVAAAAILLTVIASAFEIYPFSTRLVLFLVPLAFFTMASAIDVVALKLHWLAASVCALLLFSTMAPVALQTLIEPQVPLAKQFKEALHMIGQNSIEGDALAVEPWTGRVFKFYRRYRAPKLPTFMVHHGDGATSILERAKRDHYRRIWYLESAPVDPSAARLVEEVGSNTPIVFDWHSGGTRVVLFDFAARPQ
jgi:hypothetical protein